jgi:predicted nucleic acid-binding protein
VIRVLVDTNVVISALLFPNSTPARALALVLDEHRLVLTDWIIDELHEVVGRKRPDLLAALDTFLTGIEPVASRVGSLTGRRCLDFRR